MIGAVGEGGNVEFVMAGLGGARRRWIPGFLRNELRLGSFLNFEISGWFDLLPDVQGEWVSDQFGNMTTGGLCEAGQYLGWCGESVSRNT